MHGRGEDTTAGGISDAGGFRHGDRVRVKNPVSEYTGCRGTVLEDAADQPPGVAALGYFVAIDGENGRTRPFLAADLERLRVARVRPRTESSLVETADPTEDAASVVES